MTRYAIDSDIALRLVDDDRAVAVAAAHSLVGPAILRSHALASLYRAARDGTIDARTAKKRLEGLAGLKIRLLGDRVSRSTAFAIAERLDWEDTALAEYLAVAQLQADALVTEQPSLIAGAEGAVPIARYEDLFV